MDVPISCGSTSGSGGFVSSGSGGSFDQVLSIQARKRTCRSVAVEVEVVAVVVVVVVVVVVWWWW